jgi:hypothetical protein
MLKNKISFRAIEPGIAGLLILFTSRESAKKRSVLPRTQKYPQQGVFNNPEKIQLTVQIPLPCLTLPDFIY